MSLSVEESMESLSSMMCGRPDAFKFEDTFGLSGGVEGGDVSTDRKRRAVREKRQEDNVFPEYMIREMGLFNSMYQYSSLSYCIRLLKC
jgi:hypothetical protein